MVQPCDLIFENECCLVNMERLNNGQQSGFVNLTHKRSGFKMISAKYSAKTLDIFKRASDEIQEKFPELLNVSTPDEALALPNVEDMKRFISAYYDEI